MTFLKARYSSITPANKARRTKLNKEPFIGIWQNRQDMQNSNDEAVKSGTDILVCD